MAKIGSRNDNENNTYKIVEDVGDKIAQRVDDPQTQAKLDDVIASLGGPGFSETLQYAGTQSTTPADFPAVAANYLIEVAVICRVSNVQGDLLQVSFDGGATYLDMGPGVNVTWSPKLLTQIKLKSNGAAVQYDILINRLL